MKAVFALAALAAIAIPGIAYAGDGKWTTTTGPAAMKDAEMDRVTAAGGPPTNPGQGRLTACDVQGLILCEVHTIPNGPNAGRIVGEGRLSAPGQLP
jgi:hypothetical protein